MCACLKDKGFCRGEKAGKHPEHCHVVVSPSITPMKCEFICSRCVLCAVCCMCVRACVRAYVRACCTCAFSAKRAGAAVKHPIGIEKKRIFKRKRILKNNNMNAHLSSTLYVCQQTHAGAVQHPVQQHSG